MRTVTRDAGERRLDRFDIRYRIYRFLASVGLVLFTIYDYLRESLLVPDVIDKTSCDNCLLFSISCLLAAILLAVFNGYYSFRDMLWAFLGVVIVLFVEKQYDPIDSYSFKSVFLAYRLLDWMILIIAVRRVEFRRICLLLFITSSIMLGYIVSQRYLGVVPDKYFYDETRPFDSYRYYLGFNSFGTSSIRYINIFFTGVYSLDKYRKKSVPLWMLIAFVLLGFYFFKQTQTRLAFTIVLSGAIAYILVRKVNEYLFIGKEQVIKSLLSISFFIAPLMICVTSLCVRPTSPMYGVVNKLLSGRIRLNYRALTEYPITIRGTLMHMITNDPDSYFYVDSGYIRSLIEFGVVLFLFILFLYARLAYNSVRKKESFLVCWIALMCIYNLFNNLFFTLVCNSILLAFWEMRDNGRVFMHCNDMRNDPIRCNRRALEEQ